MFRAMEKLGEGIHESEIVFEDEILAEESELDALSEVLEDIERQAQLNLVDSTAEFSTLSVEDLLIAVLARYDKKTPLSEISLADLVSLFVDMQNPKA